MTDHNAMPATDDPDTIPYSREDLVKILDEVLQRIFPGKEYKSRRFACIVNIVAHVEGLVQDADNG